MKAKFEYKYVRVNKPSDSEGGKLPGYQLKINEYAQQGWRFVQVLAPPIGPYGVAPYYDLIFEREIEAF